MNKVKILIPFQNKKIKYELKVYGDLDYPVTLH